MLQLNLFARYLPLESAEVNHRRQEFEDELHEDEGPDRSHVGGYLEPQFVFFVVALLDQQRDPDGEADGEQFDAVAEQPLRDRTDVDGQLTIFPPKHSSVLSL